MCMHLTLLFACLAFSGLGKFALSAYGSCSSSPNDCVLISRVPVAIFPEIFTKLNAVALPDSQQSCIRPDTQPQIEGRKESASQSAVKNVPQ
jgi:hypothetical protein